MDKNVSLKPRFLFRRSIVYMKKRGKCSLIFLPNYVITLLFIYYFFVVVRGNGEDQLCSALWRCQPFLGVSLLSGGEESGNDNFVLLSDHVTFLSLCFFFDVVCKNKEAHLYFSFKPCHPSFLRVYLSRCANKSQLSP
jgi:hypothetical protein